MSIVYDFPAIKAKLRGDDWWEPQVAATVARASETEAPLVVYAFGTGVINFTPCPATISGVPTLPAPPKSFPGW